MSIDDNIPWDLVSEVRRSERKVQIIQELNNDPQCASEIAKKIELEVGTVSNYFRELKTTDPPLIKCLTPNQPHHRLYSLTETGELVHEHLL